MSKLFSTFFVKGVFYSDFIHFFLLFMRKNINYATLFPQKIFKFCIHFEPQFFQNFITRFFFFVGRHFVEQNFSSFFQNGFAHVKISSMYAVARDVIISKFPAKSGFLASISARSCIAEIF